MCYLGSLGSTSGQGGYSAENGLASDTNYLGTIQSSSVDAWMNANYKTYSSSRWNTMIYEVSTERALQECALFCYSRGEKRCQFFLHSSTDCNLGSFSSSDSAASTSGHLTVYINFGKFSRRPFFEQNLLAASVRIHSMTKQIKYFYYITPNIKENFEILV